MNKAAHMDVEITSRIDTRLLKKSNRPQALRKIVSCRHGGPVHGNRDYGDFLVKGNFDFDPNPIIWFNNPVDLIRPHLSNADR